MCACTDRRTGSSFLSGTLAVLLVVAVAAGSSPAPAASTEEGRPASETEGLAEAGSLSQGFDADSGVSVQTVCTNCNNADLSVGGLGNEHVSLVCDGVPVPPGLGQIYLLSVMPPTMIDKVAIRKGAGDTRLEAGSVGGVIEIERRRPRPELELNASADAGSYGWGGTRVDLTGRAGSIGGFLVGSWATSDPIDANADRFEVAPGVAANNELAGYDRYTLEGNAEIELGRDRSLTLGASTYAESQKDGPGGYAGSIIDSGTRLHVWKREDVELDRRQYSALYESRSRGGSRFEFSATWADRSEEIFENELFSSDIEENHRHAEASWSLPLGHRALARAGLAGTRRHFDAAQNNFVLGGLVMVEETVTERGLWAEVETSLGGRLDVSLGLRGVGFSYSDTEDRPAWLALGLPEGSRVLPRAALTWKPVDALQLRVSAGTGFRPPDPAFEEVCCGRLYRNNRGLRMERSRSVGIEATYQPTPRFKLGGSVFTVDFRDQVVKMAALAELFVPTYQNVNVPKARSASLGLETSWEVARWMTVKASVSWLDAENRSADASTLTIDPGGIDANCTGPAFVAIVDRGGGPEERAFCSEKVPFLPNRRGAVSLEFRPPRWGLTAALRAQYTGPLLTQRYARVFPPPPDSNFGTDNVQYGFAPTEDFWSVNLRVTKTFRRGISAYAGVDNISDYVQSDLGDPRFDYDWGPLRGRYYYGGLGYRFSQ